METDKDSASSDCKREHATYCFDILSAYLNGQPLPAYQGDDKDKEFPLFITWNTLRSDGSTRLRGCIGNFRAMPLSSGLQEYALTSAVKDHRFPPISLGELSRLECGVSLLTDFEDVDDPFDWELGTHGISIRFDDPVYTTPAPTDSPASTTSTESSASSSAADSGGLKSRLSSLGGAARRKVLSRTHKPLSATYLPDVPPAQSWDKQETLDSAIRKAGYNGKITDVLRQSLHVTRYKSSKYYVAYSDWKST